MRITYLVLNSAWQYHYKSKEIDKHGFLHGKIYGILTVINFIDCETSLPLCTVSEYI